jgi:hypothetical protein
LFHGYFLSLIPSPAIVLAVTAESDEIRLLRPRATPVEQEYIITHYTHLHGAGQSQPAAKRICRSKDSMLRCGSDRRAFSLDTLTLQPPIQADPLLCVQVTKLAIQAGRLTAGLVAGIGFEPMTFRL